MKILGGLDSIKDLDGRVAVVRDAGEFYDVYENDVKILSVRKNLNILEILADLGFDYAVFADCKLDIPSGEYETLKSLIRKVKSAKGSERCGAIAIFLGFVKKISDGKEVVRLEFERFDELYWQRVREIEEQMKRYEGVVDVKIYHRVGALRPGEDIVYVIVMGESRKSVYKPLEECVELIKRELPIWKKEVYKNGTIWVHDKYRK